MNGFPEEEIKRIVRSHPGIRYTTWQWIDFRSLNDGDVLEYGDFRLICILTPGHSPSHMCLYDPERKILFSGDHILFDITPNITWWSVMENSLKQYLISLDRVNSLDVELVLPGHRSRWGNLKKRVQELKDHHDRRLEEVLTALQEGEKTAWDVAPKISWDIEYSQWEDLPPIQRWFAVGETIAHLEYLVEEGKVIKNERDNRIYYSIC
jgi:glyoxylase-like metal-dependent hydrolase (beta-lactamase superfamily II)